MKKYIFYALVLSGFCLSSCDESFLDTVSTDTYNDATWWQTENQVISTINGCYTVLRNDQLYGTTAFREENISPNSYSMGGDSPVDVGNHNAGNDNRFLNKWGANYQGIGRVNYLLGNIDKVQMDQALKDRIKAEAYFLRGLFYFNLVNYYGGVPLILNQPDFTTQGSLPRNTREEVLNQILTDLNNAASVLPQSYTGANKGRATKGAAMALKARVLLYEGRWSEAAEAAKAVIDLKEYSLFPDYRGLFYLENEGNKEVIFDVQYLVPEYNNSFDIIIELQINVAPTLDLVNSYLMSDGNTTLQSPLFDPSKPYENRDSRLHKTIVIPGYMFRGSIVNNTKYFSTGYGFKKYTTYKDNVAQPSISYSEINFIVLRYADILLMYAEAQNEASGPDLSVYEAVNQVRDRAGMPDIPVGLTKDQMRTALRLERRIELAGESLYYHDIRRWRTAEFVMNGEVLNSKGAVVQRRTFNAQRDYLWPIHSTIIQENPALEQNPGY